MKNPIAPVIINRIPRFIKENHPNLFKFISDFYNWIEDDNFIDVLTKFQENAEANRESDYFIDLVLKELGCDFKNISPGNKKIVVNTLMDFYLSRGNSYSLEYLFRLFFDSDVEVSYPRKRLFVASSSKFAEENTILLSSTSIGTPEYNSIFNSDEKQYITATSQRSNYTVNVNSIIPIVINGEQYLLVNIDQPKQKFFVGETVSVQAGTNKIFEIIFNTIILEKILTRGNNYRIGDEIKIVGSEYSGYCVVSRVTRGSLIDYDIQANGLNYKVGDSIVAPASMRGIGFYGEVLTVSPFGEILTIEIRNTGMEYEILEPLTIISETGSGAVILPIGHDVGGIDEIEFTEPYWKIANNFSYQIISETGDGTAQILFSNNFCIYNKPKEYKNDFGKLGLNCILHDSLYFQEFSYEVISEVETSRYTKLLDDIVHPVGLIRYSVINQSKDVEYNFNNLDLNKFFIPVTIESVQTIKIEAVNEYRFFDGEETKFESDVQKDHLIFSGDAVFFNFHCDNILIPDSMLGGELMKTTQYNDILFGDQLTPTGESSIIEFEPVIGI